LIQDVSDGLDPTLNVIDFNRNSIGLAQGGDFPIQLGALILGLVLLLSSLNDHPTLTIISAGIAEIGRK
jgi:hypothetical protein